MTNIAALLNRSGVHDEWRERLADALAAVDPDYLESLLRDDNWLPGIDRLLAAFRRDRAGLRYLLIGESPYPARNRPTASRSTTPPSASCGATTA